MQIGELHVVSLRDANCLSRFEPLDQHVQAGIKKGGSPLFDRLASLVQQKKIAIPASGVLLMELLAVKNPEQRKDVGAVIRQLTDRFIIRDFDNVLRMEVTNAVVDYYGGERRFTLPIMAFGFGYLEAFGYVKLELGEGSQAICRRRPRRWIVTGRFLRVRVP